MQQSSKISNGVKKKIGIIGANGFVGKHLIDEIYNKYSQYEIVAFVYNTREQKVDFEEKVKAVKKLNVLDKQALKEELSGIDVLVQAVKGSVEVIVQGLENTLEAAEKSGIKKIIYLSSIVVFGEKPDQEINEDSPLIRKQINPYNIAKVKAESIVDFYRKKGKLNIITIRPGYIYGEGGLDHTIYFLNQIKDGFKNFYLPKHGRGAFNGVYVKNLVHMIMRAVELPINNENFNGLDGYHLTWADLFRAYGNILKKDIEPLLLKNEKNFILIKNNFLSKIKGRLLKKISPGKIFLSQGEYDIYNCSFYYQLDKAKKLLNYSPPFSFKKAMENIKNWAEKNYEV